MRGKEGAALTLDKHHSGGAGDVLAELLTIAKRSGKNPLAVAASYARLARGEGRLSPQDFIDLRLYDDAQYRGADLGAFIGKRRNRDLCYEVNYRRDWLAVPENKLLSAAYLGMFGLPVVRPLAIFAPFLHRAGENILHDADEIGEFLRGAAYPLFCKPAESAGSLGSVALARHIAETDELEKPDGSRLRLDALIADITTHYADGYIFQPLLAPEASIARVTGERIATVRFVTIRARRGIEIIRAVWKLPAGANAADNYWREGNLLAKVDPANGTVERVTSGAGPSAKEHETHPDTGEPLIGFAHPRWEEMKALALEGARLMRAIPLLGWDIACTDRGPVAVELNENPDFFLMQFADRRGMFDADFKDFIAFQKEERERFQQEMARRAALL